MDDFKLMRFFDWLMWFNIVMGIVKGLVYFYYDCQEWIVYLDIKFQNILLDDMFNVKVLDFGFVKLMSWLDISQVKIF